jgi:nitrogen fixation protein NifU and related proteins
MNDANDNSLLDELYQSMILEHSRHPRHAVLLDNPDGIAHGHNPLCGDTLCCTLRLKNKTIADIGLKADGCALCMASASLLSEGLKDKTLEEAQAFCQNFMDSLTQEKIPSSHLGKLSVFQGVRQFPLRVKCVTLAGHTVQQACANSQGEKT